VYGVVYDIFMPAFSKSSSASKETLIVF